ncbi:MAG: HypC/HybG/HupF family hydrogenase formation chaperone [Acidobacteriota bacterium]
MCLAIPMELKERDEYEGIVELGGVQRRVSLLLFPEAAVGDHLLIHAGFAIGRVDAEEARLTIEGLERLAAEAHPS